MEIPPPVTDDKPYFYSFRNTTDKWVYLNQTVVPMSLLGFTLVFGLVSLFAPALNVATFKMTWPIFWCTIYFSLAGFAFLLYETVIIQLFGIFVGGPMYSLTVVLVSVLGGYSLGCILANRLALQRKVFLFAAAILGVLFVALYFLIPNITHSLLHLPLPARLAICAVLTVLVTAVIGATVSSAMAVVRQKYQSVVSWMWGVSSVANAIGAVSFISITQQTGISACLLICAACYVLANALFGLLVETE
jgi:predicted MFS family arabinose efflux permease